MTDHAAFLRSIIAHADDDLPRLVYADWLEENGQADRAEFIRVQCELAKEPTTCDRMFCDGKLVVCDDCKRWKMLRRRDKDLLDTPIIIDERGRLQPRCLWAVGCGLGWADFEYRRGFVEQISCTWSDWLQRGDAIRRACPLRRVRLMPVPAGRGIMRDIEIMFDLSRTYGLDWRPGDEWDRWERVLQARWPATFDADGSPVLPSVEFELLRAESIPFV